MQPTNQPSLLLRLQKTAKTAKQSGCVAEKARINEGQTKTIRSPTVSCVGVSRAEARTTANGSSGVSKQPSHPPLVPFFSAACRLRPPTSSKAGYFSKHPQSRTICFFSVLSKHSRVFFASFFSSQGKTLDPIGPSWTQVNFRLPAGAVVTFCPPPPPLSHNNGCHCAVLHS